MADVQVTINNPPNSGYALIYHEGYTHAENLMNNFSNPLVINISIPYLYANELTKTVTVSMTDNPACSNNYSYQAPSLCANVFYGQIACACLPPNPANYDFVCDDGIDQFTIIGETGFIGVAWYNSSGEFISTDQNLIITSSTPGMQDGIEYFFMHGINNEGTRPINCCREPIVVRNCQGCAPNDQLHVEDGDVYIDNACHGVILTAPNGLCYRMMVGNDGAFISEITDCPD